MPDLQVSIQFILQQAGDAAAQLGQFVQALTDMGAKQIGIAQGLVDAEEKATQDRISSDQKLLVSRINTYNKIEELYRKEAQAMQDLAAKEIQAQVQREQRMQKEADAIMASMKKEEAAALAAQEAGEAKRLANEQAFFEKQLTAQIAADEKQRKEAAALYQAMLRDEEAFKQQQQKDSTGGFFAQLSKSLIGLTLFRQALRQAESVVREAFSSFEEYDQHLARINAIYPMTTEGTEKFSRSLLDLSTRLPVATTELAEAAETYLRAGGDIANANKFVEDTGRLAVGTQSSMKASTELVIDTMKNYGVEMSRQGEITDFFTALSIKSRTNLDELQGSFGRLSIVASNSGVSLQELGAVFSTLRESGLTTQQATVGLEQAIQRIMDPTAKVRDQLRGWGVDAKTLQGRLEQLKESGLKEGDLLEIFGSRTGLRAIQPLLNGLDGIKQKELELRNAAGETSRAFDTQSDTVAARVQLMKNAWQGFTDQALASLSGVLKPIFDILGGIARGLEHLSGPVQGAIVGMVGLEAAGMGVILMFRSMGVAVSMTGPIGIGLLVIGALAGAVLKLAGAEREEQAERARMVASVSEQAERMDSLITQYKALAGRVEESKKNSKDEADAKKELKGITDKLIEIHPEYKKALDDENISLAAKLKLLDGIVEAEQKDIQKKRDSLEVQKVQLQQDLAALDRAKNDKFSLGAAANALGRGYLTGVTDGSAAEKVKEQIAEIDRQMATLDTTLDKTEGKAKEAGAVIAGIGTGGESSKNKTKEMVSAQELLIRRLQDEIETMPRATAVEKDAIAIKELEVATLRKIDQARKDYTGGRITEAEKDREIAAANTAFEQGKARITQEGEDKRKSIIEKTMEEITARENESFGKRRGALESYYNERIIKLKEAGASESQITVAEAAKTKALEQEYHQETLQSEQIFQKRLKEAEETTGQNFGLEQKIALVKELANAQIITAQAADTMTKAFERQKDGAAGWAAGWRDAVLKFDDNFKYMHDQAIKLMDGLESAASRVFTSLVTGSGTAGERIKKAIKESATAIIGDLISMGVHQLIYSAIHTKTTQQQTKEAAAAAHTETSGNIAAATSGKLLTAVNAAKTVSFGTAAAAAETESGALDKLAVSEAAAAVAGQINAAATYFETYAGIPFVGPVLAAAAVIAMETEMAAAAGAAASVVGFADGAIVSKPTLAVIGEGGEEEAVVPKSALRSFLNDIVRTSSWARAPQASMPETASGAPADSIMGGSEKPMHLTLSIPHGVFMDTSRRGKGEFMDYIAEGVSTALSGRLGRKVVGQALKAGQ